MTRAPDHCIGHIWTSQNVLAMVSNQEGCLKDSSYLLHFLVLLL